MLFRLQIAYHRFTIIKSDLRRHQKEVFDCKARFLAIPPSKLVYIRKEPQTSKTGEATQFLLTFDGPFIVTSHKYDRNDLLTLKHLSTGAALPRPVNIEKCVVVPDQDTFDLQPPSDAVVVPESEKEVPAPPPNVFHVWSLASICLHYLTKLPQSLRHANRLS